jgi:hypothetical protein
MRFTIERRNPGIEEAQGSPTANRCIPNMVRLSDGSIVLSTRVGTHRESNDGRMRISHDGGRTWPSHVVAAASDRVRDPHDTMWFDPRIARLQDGRLVMLFYAFRHGSSTDGPNHVSWSTDDGRTWSRPAPMPLHGRRPTRCRSPMGSWCFSSEDRTRR